MIRRLVMSGGGCSAIAYIGVLKYLESHGYRDRITHVAGTSMGASLALLWALLVPIDGDFIGYALEFFSKKIEFGYDFDFEKFGIDDGHLFEDMFAGYLPRPDFTFAELYAETGINLVITATCLDTKSPMYFSHENTPEVPVLTALKASIAVPFFTHAVRINGRLYADGGLADNLPIFAWGLDVPKEEILAVRVTYDIPKLGPVPTNIFEYAVSILDTLVKNYDFNERFLKQDQCIILNNCPLAFLPIKFNDTGIELKIQPADISASIDYGFGCAAAALTALSSSSDVRSPEYSESSIHTLGKPLMPFS